ncbi:MAG: hypothetical protein HC805_00460 [Alkalinema sp. RL_2_19]|nr:hypothetical protein [Alkalinema sp. RL_2_19]
MLKWEMSEEEIAEELKLTPERVKELIQIAQTLN